MFQAIGRGVSVNGDGTFSVKVEILDDRTDKSIDVRSYTVGSLEELQSAVGDDLQAMVSRKVAVDEARLSKAIVGQQLGSI
jgi:hypothetical protein